MTFGHALAHRPGSGLLQELLTTDTIVVCAASLARFYGEPLRWALALPLPELLRWQGLMPAVREHDPWASAVWVRKPPGANS